MATRTSPTSHEWHPAVEQYCETIYELREDDVDVIQARIAERLEVSRPAVSEMIRRLETDGFVQVGDSITLTTSGLEVAERVVRRHRIAERFLTDILQLSWADAHSEAGKWEHIISPMVEEAMTRLLGAPTTCPHGNPIPGTAYEPGDTRQLAQVAVSQPFTVVRIFEALEFSPGLLEYLESSAITPGRMGRLTARSPDGTCTVEVDGNHVGVSAYVAERILVAAARPAISS